MVFRLYQFIISDSSKSYLSLGLIQLAHVSEVPADSNVFVVSE